jgi:glutamyl-tRNA(Gln) amidotransferase subunit D
MKKKPAREETKKMGQKAKESTPKTGEFVRIKQGENEFEGTVLPETKKGFLDLKLKNGYNISVYWSKKTEIVPMKKTVKTIPEPKKISFNPQLPSILILHTGGTIASRVNYETGGVFAAFTPEDLLAMFPELTKKANFETKLVENMESENMRFVHYSLIANEIQKAMQSNKFSGIIVSHGTDTMAFTSAALAFMIQNPPVPVLLVGAQRSSDRGSSDAAMNLSCATDFITKTNFAGTGICMHENENDDNCVILPAVKTRKMHSSRRDAFKTINSQPIARIEYKTSEIRFLQNYPFYSKRTAQVPLLARTKMEEKVGLLKSVPTLLPEQIAFFEKQKFKGLIIEGTGLGHLPILSRGKIEKTNEKNFKALQSLIKKGCLVGMTTQCLYGSVDMNVYSAGRELLKIGVLDGKDMLPETALIKMAWLLANYPKKEASELFSRNVAGEINERTRIDSKAPEA